MSDFDGISFTWALIGIGVLALTFAGRALLGYRAVRSDAQADFEYKTREGMIPGGLDRETYTAIYRRVFAPRGSAYIAGALLAILIATPIAMILFEKGLDLIYHLSGQNRVIEPGFLVWQFFLFFGIIAVWVGTAYLAARRYHAAAPGGLQHEIDAHLYGDSDYGAEF